MAEQAQLALQWDTEITAMKDGSFLVRPVRPVQVQDPNAVLSVEEAAGQLKMSARLARRLCQEGELFAYRQRQKIWKIPMAAVRVYRRFQAGGITRGEMEAEMDALKDAAGR